MLDRLGELAAQSVEALELSDDPMAATVSDWWDDAIDAANDESDGWEREARHLLRRIDSVETDHCLGYAERAIGLIDKCEARQPCRRTGYARRVAR